MKQYLKEIFRQQVILPEDAAMGKKTNSDPTRYSSEVGALLAYAGKNMKSFDIANAEKHLNKAKLINPTLVINDVIKIKQHLDINKVTTLLFQ